MTTVRMPRVLGGDTAAANRLRDRLLFDHAIEVQVVAWRERLWMRISIQVYNEVEDLELLADAIAAIART